MKLIQTLFKTVQHEERISLRYIVEDTNNEVFCSTETPYYRLMYKLLEGEMTLVGVFNLTREMVPSGKSYNGTEDFTKTVMYTALRNRGFTKHPQINLKPLEEKVLKTVIEPLLEKLLPTARRLHVTKDSQGIKIFCHNASGLSLKVSCSTLGERFSYLVEIQNLNTLMRNRLESDDVGQLFLLLDHYFI